MLSIALKLQRTPMSRFPFFSHAELRKSTAVGSVLHVHQDQGAILTCLQATRGSGQDFSHMNT